MAASTRGASSALQVFMCLAGIWWYLYWILLPTHSGRAWLNKIASHTQWKFLGARGSVVFFQTLPVCIIALLTYIALELRKRSLRTQSGAVEKPKVNVWTLPILLQSPLGMLTLADVVFIFVNLFVVVFYFTKSTVDKVREIDEMIMTPGIPAKWKLKLEAVALRFGVAAVIPFALLWFPVSRGSPILRFTGVPFERAVKYHTWLGMLTIWLLAAHGLCFIVFFSFGLHEPKIILHWHGQGVAIVPGWIALAAGLMMFVTALERVRRKSFDIFFTVHHLYLVFLVFFVFHVAAFVHYYVAPVLLFFLDRFFRMVQSRRKVDVLSARILPSGAMELKFSKPSSLNYYPLSFLYVLFPSVSRFEWHPFSVASSPLDDTNQISIYIKPLGGYTKNLHSVLVNSNKSKEAGMLVCPFSFKLALEGPYGDESSFYLKYRSLVLVAGGIGITPFLAILRDILHRHRLKEQDVPCNIQLIYCVRNPKEMCILDTLNLHELCPNYADSLNIVFHPFVTSQIKPQNYNADGQVEISSSSYEDFSYINMNEPVIEVLGKPVSEAEPMSVIHATGQSRWVATTVFSTMIGFFILWGIFNVTVIDENYPNYGKALLFLACVFLAVVVFGGGVMFLWSMSIKSLYHKRHNKVISKGSLPSSPAIEMTANSQATDSDTQGASPWLGNVTLGRRPDWKDMFEQIAKQYAGQNVGVLVSGGSKMAADVARECKQHSLSRNSNVVLHYHSVSFEL
ncbi:ferric-chelate reductase [Marchantia polymorpha subsp. ruderalis]